MATHDPPPCSSTEPDDANDADLFVAMLPQLSPICITISKWFILEQALQRLGHTVHSIGTSDFDSGEIVANICIGVPLRVSNNMLDCKTFYGDFSETTGQAIESACMAALVYLQTENLIIVDDANFAELRNCQRKLLEAKSWASAFEGCTLSLKQKLADMQDKGPIPAATTPASSRKVIAARGTTSKVMLPYGDSARINPIRARKALFLASQDNETAGQTSSYLDGSGGMKPCAK